MTVRFSPYELIEELYGAIELLLPLAKESKQKSAAEAIETANMALQNVDDDGKDESELDDDDEGE